MGCVCVCVGGHPNTLFTRIAALIRFDFNPPEKPKSAFFYDPLTRIRSNFPRINHGSGSSSASPMSFLSAF